MLYRLRRYLQLSRARGRGTAVSLLCHLPAAAAGRAWRRAGAWCNNRLLGPTLCAARLARFQRRRRRRDGVGFYVIVMPGTLHFLIPCLRQLPERVQVTLLFNGAAGWECRLLRRLFPGRDSVRLFTLPRSSLGHGELISLLLRSDPCDFGLLDHDLFVFDPGVFERLAFGQSHCMLAGFGDRSEVLGRHYPHTWFLYLRREPLHRLMRSYRVDARSYRRAPRRVRAPLAALGLAGKARLKGYHDFFDTLHVLLALAWHEGLEVGFVAFEARDLMHLGGTSTGSLATKELDQLYISLKFLEHVAIPELTARYLPAHRPFRSAAALAPRLGAAREVSTMMRELDQMLARLATPA